MSKVRFSLRTLLVRNNKQTSRQTLFSCLTLPPGLPVPSTLVPKKRADRYDATHGLENPLPVKPFKQGL